MNCEECINVMIRKRMDGSIDRICCLDGKGMGVVVECNQFFRKVDDAPLIESVMPPELGKVVDLGYGAVQKKRGRPKKR